MNFDQIGEQHVSRRRRPSPISSARRPPSSFDASFSQKVWPRDRSRVYRSKHENKPRRPRGTGFSIPVSWVKHLAIGAGILVIGIVGPNWESISGWFRSYEVSPLSLQNTSPPLAFRAASIEHMGLWDFDEQAVFDGMPLDLTDTFSWTDYRVQAGDTISGIAARFSLTMDTIIAFNDLREAWNLRIGRTLRIPNMNGIPYTVARNDTLSSIS